MMNETFQIITFYEFKRLDDLPSIKQSLTDAMREHSINGTIILADEGYNATVCGLPDGIEKFVAAAEKSFDAKLKYKTSFHDARPFHKIKVRIKTEIVALRQKVEIEKGIGTHKSAAEWNTIISDAATIILDTRNDYEVELGTFRGAVNPNIEKFSDLPAFVAENFDARQHTKIALFCTGGIRCEKFAPWMKSLGFAEVFQLEGGILKYLEETSEEESLWQGECFVFDDRIAVDHDLRGGNTADARPLSVNPPLKKK